jgi:hypothetical protein
MAEKPKVVKFQWEERFEQEDGLTRLVIHLDQPLPEPPQGVISRVNKGSYDPPFKDLVAIGGVDRIRLQGCHAIVFEIGRLFTDAVRLEKLRGDVLGVLVSYFKCDFIPDK